MEKVSNGHYEEERALYGLRDAEVENCLFAGKEDGESPLKECRDIVVKGCSFSLRYPLWHLRGGKIEDTTLTDLARAGLWYGEDVEIVSSNLLAVKFMRECKRISYLDSRIEGDEFGWKSSSIRLKDTSVKSMYSFLDSKDIEAKGMDLDGKYSLQYIEDSHFENCSFKGRDAFWHAKNVTVVDSSFEGEYLSWYSEGLTLIRCHINSHQPLCYCKNLRLIDCTFGPESDLALENSEANGTIKGRVPSIKNLAAGRIEVEEVGELVHEPDVYQLKGEIVVKTPSK